MAATSPSNSSLTPNHRRPTASVHGPSLSVECRLVHLAFRLVRDGREPAWHLPPIAGAGASIATHRRIRGRLQRQRGTKRLLSRSEEHTSELQSLMRI